MPRATTLLAALLVLLPAAARSAAAGHESPFYPSYYPQEIRIETVAPGDAAAALRTGTLHAYAGADPFEGAPLPREVEGVESLAAYLVARTDPAASREARCAEADRAAAALAGGGRAHPYAVTPYHADSLLHADRVEAARARVRAAPPAALARVDRVPLDDLLAGVRTAGLGRIGPPWLKAGWFHAYRLQAAAMTDPEARRRADEAYRRLVAGEHRTPAERADLERSLVATLASGCERPVVGYVTRREAFSADYSAGIENVGFDAHEGLASAVFVRTAKLKDFPWNGWLRLGVATPPAAAWNPVSGFGDPAGRLLWAAIGDPALLPDPYGGGWAPNRVVVEGWQADPPVARYRVLASLFHDGTRMTEADLQAAYRFGGGRDRVADVRLARTERRAVPLGADLTLTYDVLHVEVALRPPAGRPEDAVALAPPWTSVPWHVLALVDEAASRGLAALSEEEARRRGLPWLDLVRDQRVKVALAGLVERFAREGFVPAPLAPWVTPAQARLRWAALRAFFKRHGHLLVANGPYQLEHWSAHSAVLRVFRDLSYPLGVGTFDRFALPRRAFVTKAEVAGGRLEVTADVERVFRFQRSYEIVREPFTAAGGADQARADTLVCRYVALGADGRVVALGEREPTGDRFTVDLPGGGPGTVLVALVLNGNTVDPDVRVVPWTR